MVLVRMGDHERPDVALLTNEKADVRHDEIDAGQILAGEGDAEIDRDPGALARRPEPVKRQVHADFANPAERCEDKLVGPVAHAGRQREAESEAAPALGAATGNTSPAVILRRSPPVSISTRFPSSSIVSKSPVTSPSAKRTRSAAPGAGPCASQAARMSAKRE